MKKFFYYLAEVISYLLNPFLLGFVIVIMAIFKSKMSEELKLGWYVAVFIINAFIPTIIYYSLIKLGYVFDDELDNEKVHRQRVILLASLLLLTTVEFLILLLSGSYQPLLAIFAGGIITLTIGIIITYFWKISWHSAAATFFSYMLIYLYGMNAWWAILFPLIVIWSRLYLKRHNIWQLLGGICAALLVIFSTFSYFHFLK